MEDGIPRNRFRRFRLSVDQQTDLFRSLKAKSLISAASAYAGRNMIDLDLFLVNLKDFVDQFLVTLRGSTPCTCEHVYFLNSTTAPPLPYSGP